jgi:hypothetical protein
MTACGYTPADMDEMPFADVLGLYAYWQEFPPIHEILKCVYGIQCNTDRNAKASESDPSGIGGLISRYPQGFVREL